ncbi:retrotransposon protein, putative, ty1-copia subclass [Tanacetum coccineum]
MTRKSFPHRPEKATDLFGIIHTDVCGPLRHVSRQGASYFITFTDDYSRYGYVYLLKHKHEILKKFPNEDTSPSEITSEIPIEVEEIVSKAFDYMVKMLTMDKILKRYKMDNSKHGHIPMQERLDLNKTQGASTPKEVKLSERNLMLRLWFSITAMKIILKYLRNTKDMFLVYGGNPKLNFELIAIANPVETGNFILEDGKVLTLSRKSSPSRNCIYQGQPCGALDWCCEGLVCDGFFKGTCK